MRRSIMLAALGGLFLTCTSAGWRTDFAKAKDEAKAEHKLILLSFSGSDWCLPCIKMEKQVFEQPVFSQYASEKLELVNADFPRQSKHKPDKAVASQNDMLAELYNKEGHFPYVVLLTDDGKVLKVWDGYTGQKPEDLIHDIESVAQN